MTRIAIIIVGIMLIYFGFKKITINSEAFENTVEVAEKSDLSEYDYFKLSEGYMISNVLFEESKITDNVNKFIYPLVSKKYLDSLYYVFFETFPSAKDDEFMDWFDKQNKKPKIYVQSEQKNITKAQLQKILDTDTTIKKIEGTRLLNFFDLTTEMKEEFEKNGITPENTIFIEEGATPPGNKGLGWVILIIGSLISVGSIRSFIKAAEQA